jgi:hypothetical protein
VAGSEGLGCLNDALRMRESKLHDRVRLPLGPKRRSTPRAHASKDTRTTEALFLDNNVELVSDRRVRDHDHVVANHDLVGFC